MKLKRTIIIEIDRVKITTAHCAKNIFQCELCGTDTEFLSRTEASELTRIMREQGLHINQAELHFYYPNDAQILVCLDSIIAGKNPIAINKTYETEA